MDKLNFMTSYLYLFLSIKVQLMVVAYFVHDLSDPAVVRRIAMFQRGGASVRAFGFRRGDCLASAPSGAAVCDLGRTADGRLFSRIGSLFLAALRLIGLGRELEGTQHLAARNLESLLLASLAHRLFAPSASVTYELLDIHSLMVGEGVVAKLLRGLEGLLMRGCSGIIISSPAFSDQYLDRYHPEHPPVILVENKVLLPAGAVPPQVMIRSGPPWRIGWFGNLRCRRSLDCLLAIARRFPHDVEIEIRGKLAHPALMGLSQEIIALPNIRFHGPYGQGELEAIYGAVHFTWAIDFYEAGYNSKWLLPNRLYEGCLYGSVPIALAAVQTGWWLAERKIGLLLDEPIEESLTRQLSGMTPEAYGLLAEPVATADRSLFLCDDSACRALVDALASRR